MPDLSINEKTKMLEMALKYTNNDPEKAKAMIAGQYNDIVVAKAKIAFHKSGKSGMLMAFFNVNLKYMAFIDTLLMSNSDLYNKVRVFNDWKSLMKDLSNYDKDDSIIRNSTLTEKLYEKLADPKMFAIVTSKQLDEATRALNNILSNIFPEDRISSQLELEDASSLGVGGSGIYINIPQSEQPAVQQAPAEQKPVEAAELSPFDLKRAEIESEADYVVEGVSIVSPVKGKYIGDLVPGDVVMILLPKGDAISKKILDAVKAIGNDGSIKPVKGRLKYKVVEGKGPYYLYLLVAKGVYAKLIEDENVKIRVESTGQDTKEEKGPPFLLIAIAFIVFLVIAGIVFINFFGGK